MQHKFSYQAVVICLVAAVFCSCAGIKPASNKPVVDTVVVYKSDYRVDTVLADNAAYYTQLDSLLGVVDSLQSGFADSADIEFNKIFSKCDYWRMQADKAASQIGVLKRAISRLRSFQLKPDTIKVYQKEFKKITARERIKEDYLPTWKLMAAIIGLIGSFGVAYLRNKRKKK